MSETNTDKSYQVKNVGKYWLIRSAGNRFRKCPILTNAKEVDISDNFLIADDVIYQIQQDGAGEVILVKVDDTPMHYKQPHLEDELENENLPKETTHKQESTADKKASFPAEYKTEENNNTLNTNNTDKKRSKNTARNEKHIAKQNVKAVSIEEKTSFRGKIICEDKCMLFDKAKIGNRKVQNEKRESASGQSYPASGQSIEATSKEIDYDKKSKIDELEMGQTEDDYHSLDAGHTEEISLIERIYAEDKAGTSKVTSNVSRMSGPSIRVVKDSLEAVKADVLACTVSSDLDLSRGAVSAALLKKGGRKLQEDLDAISHERLRFCEIGVVSGHNLACMYVFFGVMYPYNKEFAKGYKSQEQFYRSKVHEFVEKCLTLAELKKIRTIAFPAIGSGILQYPVQIVADEMFETVTDWRGEHVKEVRFVIYPSDGNVLMEFKSAEKRNVGRDLRFLLHPRGKADPDCSKHLEETGDASSPLEPAAISRQFSWLACTKALNVFQTKEKIIVKVYSADILSVPVDCIVNAVIVDFKRGGGIARAIEKAAGKDLTQEARDYLEMRGRLKVGEACSTAAGKMQYRCVIHVVGPCWSRYKPYSLGDVEKCEHDLYNAVMNSLAKAEKRKMENVAVSSISSGMYGCPLELCSIQYARAVVDYSRLSRSRLKEIHFVNTNMEMVKIIQTTFQSMLQGEKIPRSYNKLSYVKAEDAPDERDTEERQSDFKVIYKDDNSYQSRHRPTGVSGIVVYPYCHKAFPPGHKQKEFSCCFGAGQNLYIYTGDILSLTNTDMIVCGDIPNGKATGKLAKALSDSGGKLYRNGKEAAFKKDRTFGEVIVCTSGDIKNFKWVAHAILHRNSDCEDRNDREFKMNSMFQNVFETLRDRHCHSLAIPLIGTGKGKGDPGYYSERFIDALLYFCSSNKEYRFRIHLINKEREKTKLAVDATKKAVQESCPRSMVTKRTNAQRSHSIQNAVARSLESNYAKEQFSHGYTKNESDKYEVHDDEEEAYQDIIRQE